MWLDFHLIRWYKISLGLLGLFYCLQPGAMVFVQDYWTVLFICMVVIQEVDGNSDILDSTATIEHWFFIARTMLEAANMYEECIQVQVLSDLSREI